MIFPGFKVPSESFLFKNFKTGLTFCHMRFFNFQNLVRTCQHMGGTPCIWSILYIWGTNEYETPCRGNEAIFAVVEKSCFAASQYNEVHFLAMMAILGWNIFSKSILIFLRLILNIEGVSKVSRLTYCRFTTISSQISAIYIIIFHKTEVQTVILRCWTGLYLNWFKSYDKNEKHGKNAKKPKITKTVHGLFFFLQNRTKTKMEKIAFCAITFKPIKIQTHSAPQNDCLNFNIVKDNHVIIVIVLKKKIF